MDSKASPSDQRFFCQINLVVLEGSFRFFNIIKISNLRNDEWFLIVCNEMVAEFLMILDDLKTTKNSVLHNKYISC